MSRITSIKELQATCDELYNYFVERLTQVTEIEPINKANLTGFCLHIVKTKYCDNCIKIRKYIDGTVAFWADGWNGLEIGTYSDNNAIEISRNSNLVDGKSYTNKNGQKTADQKKRAILLDLKAKLETLFKDYL
jgi:hypothetical protein